MSIRVRMQITLSATPERVFQALTTQSALTTWFCEQAQVNLETKQYDFGGKFTPAQAHAQHPVIEFILNRSLTYQWQILGHDTHVTLQLHPKDDKTILTLHQVTLPDSPTPPLTITLEDFWFLSLENLRRYLDGKPCDVRIDYTQPMKGNISVSVDIDAPASRVFEVLTHSSELERWIATKATVEPQQGGKYSFGWGEPDGAVRIIELVPDEKLAVQWDEPTSPTENRTNVLTWTLEDSGGKTHMTFTHSGFADEDDVRGIYGGWHNFMNWARSLAEYGANWQSPLVVTKPTDVGYAASILNHQADILEVLKQ